MTVLMKVWIFPQSLEALQDKVFRKQRQNIKVDYMVMTVYCFLARLNIFCQV